MKNTDIQTIPASLIDTLVDESLVDLKQSIKEMWRENFEVDEAWLDMYFDRVFRTDQLVTLTARDDDDLIASSLLLQRYMFYFHGVPMPMGYISGATTRADYRDRGYMKQLIGDALEMSYNRGDMFVSLIPASQRLFDYYSRFGFATVFYNDEERYTEKHKFEFSGNYTAINPADNHEVFAAFDSMLKDRDNIVLHDYRDFQNILLDTTLDGGHTLVLRDDNSAHIVAIAIIVPNDERVVVKELLTTDNDAREAALAYAHNLYPGKPMTVMTPPDNRHIPIHARGMARLVNAHKLLAAFAARFPKLSYSIRLTDTLLPYNNHIYIIDRGELVVNDGFGGHLDLDVTPEILLSILCSDSPIGEIFHLPTARPYISMMLE